MSRKMFTSMLARIIDGVLCAATSFITGVRPKQPQQLDCPSEGTVYYANHNSHGDFVLVWISLPKRWRIHARPVAGADYWLRGRLRRFVIEEVFRGLLVDRQGGDPQQMIAQMGEALRQGDSLIIFPEGTRNTSDEVRLLRVWLCALALALLLVLCLLFAAAVAPLSASLSF